MLYVCFWDKREDLGCFYDALGTIKFILLPLNKSIMRIL